MGARCEEERVTVGRGLQDSLRTNDAAGPGSVLDDDVLADFRRQFLGEQTSHYLTVADPGGNATTIRMGWVGQAAVWAQPARPWELRCHAR